MSTATALLLVAGLIGYALLDHLLRIRRASRYATPDATSSTHEAPEPFESEARMSMSDQQLRTLGLAHVRKAVTNGKAKPADIERWKNELGADAVQGIVDAAKGTAASAPASREQKKAATATTSAKE